MKPKLYDKFPLWIVLLANLVMLLTLVTGLYITFTLHWTIGILYIILIALLEFSVYKEGCRYCCYYGGGCAFGKGRIAAIFFKKGDPKKFSQKEVSFKDFLPYLLPNLIPLVIGIILLISRGFNILILIATIYPVFSWLVLNPLIYGELACPHCKQCSKCPAAQYFIKKEKEKLKRKKKK